MAKNLQNLLIYHFHDKTLYAYAKKYLHGRLIDIGCGTKPYKNMLASYVKEYVGLDREQPFNIQAQPDLIGTAYKIPVEDCSFDSALSTAVLEHLAEPEMALHECNRILKKDGVAIYTVPLIWHVHGEPWDYYRFTNYGLQYIFEKTGFEVVELKALSGFWVTFGQMFVYYIYRFNRRPIFYMPIIPIFGLLVQGIAYLLNMIDKAEQWTWMYLVVIKKK